MKKVRKTHKQKFNKRSQKSITIFCKFSEKLETTIGLTLIALTAQK